MWSAVGISALSHSNAMTRILVRLVALVAFVAALAAAQCGTDADCHLNGKVRRLPSALREYPLSRDTSIGVFGSSMLYHTK